MGTVTPLRKPDPPLGGWDRGRYATLALVIGMIAGLLYMMSKTILPVNVGRDVFVVLGGLALAVVIIRNCGRN